MFDIAPSELLLTAIVAIVVIGPKDMPLALRTAGRWIGKMRRMSNHLRSGFDTMIREAEMEEMERKWREQNQAIMAAHPSAAADGAPAMLPLPAPVEHAPIEHTPVEPAPEPVEAASEPAAEARPEPASLAPQFADHARQQAPAQPYAQPHLP